MAAEPEFPYVELAAQLRERASRIGVNGRMPSIDAICQEYGRSPKTVRKALRLLEEEGVVTVKPNFGTFVRRRE
jgi:DNA-binding GntR family transcriptional regulator